MDLKRAENGRSYRLAVLGFLLTFCLVATPYCHFVLRTEVVFTHLFYVPIILAGLWWSRKGILVAVLLASLLLVSHALSPLQTPTGADVSRSLTFVVVGTTVAILNEKRLELEARLRAQGADLEERVEERTTELRELHERQRAILDSLADAIIVLDGDLSIVWANKVALSQYGAVLGKKCYEACKWLDQPCPDCVTRETFANGRIRSSEEEGFLKNGTRICFVASCSPIRDPHGAIVSVVEVLRDITERKSAEDLVRFQRDLALELSATAGLEHALRLCLDAAIRVSEMDCGGVYLVDDDSRSLDLIVHEGLSADFVGSTSRFNADSDSTQTVMAGKAVYSQHQALDVSLDETRRREGLRAIAILPVRHEGRVIGCLNVASHTLHEVPVFARDALETITAELGSVIARLKAEEELGRYRHHLEQLVEQRTAELTVAKEQAEAADRLKSVFLAAMSHELRTPLNSIVGFTDVMLQGLAGPLTDEGTRQLGIVQSNAYHLLKVINDGLDISRIEAGRLEIDFGSFDMREAVERVARTVAPRAEKKGVALLTGVAPEVGHIVSDQRRVEQILMNLIDNALEFTEKGEIRVECEISDPWLVTRVVDTGIGIKPDEMSKLFQPFQQTEMGMSHRNPGSGLGLSICKSLAEMLGGEIRAESERGVGSTFTFRLPVA